MRAVAKGAVAGMLATAEGDFAGLFYHHFFWSKTATFVRTIAKGLVAALATGTPKVGAGLDFHNVRSFLGDVGLISHKETIEVLK